jgi:hypothetical protein
MIGFSNPARLSCVCIYIPRYGSGKCIYLIYEIYMAASELSNCVN